MHPRRCASRAAGLIASNHPWCLDRPAHPCACAHRREMRFNTSRESPARPALLGLAGSLRRYIPCTDRECGDPSPHPCGPCPQSLRCSARKRGTQDRETGQNQHQDQSRHYALAVFAFRFRLLRQAMPPQWGPCGAASGRRKARRVARTMRASSLRAHGCVLSEPRSTLAKSQGRMPGDRSTGVAFSLVTFYWPLKRK